MSDVETTEPRGALLLDPFEYHGHTASCIAGLGGDHPNPDAAYAFHTGYVPVARGYAHFTVRFRNLRARFGTLWLRIHMLPAEPGAAARMVTSDRVQLNRLVHHGGETFVKFEAFHGATYALMGLIPDRTDASAEDLSVELDRPFDPDQDDDRISIDDASSTVFGTKAVKPASQLLSMEAPVFSKPVSQPFTPMQLAEPAFRRWLAEAGSGSSEENWARAYLLQALETYGMLQAGARGLVFGSMPSGIAELFDRTGLRHEQVALTGDAVRATEDAPPSREVDPVVLPSGLIAFDFLCSIHASDRFEDERAAAAFIEKTMECLRPGGIAVHVVLACAAFARRHEEAGPTCFDRNAIERIVLGLISRGHDVARLKPLSTRELSGREIYRPRPFGLIARRARSIL